MSAEVLRRAAVQMRERAEAAPGAPWITRPTAFGDPANGPTHMVVENQRGAISEHDYDRWGGTSAEHIASWHPAVALAVADWLDGVALFVEAKDEEEYFDLDGDPIAPEDTHAIGSALDVARAYLGEPA